MPATFRPGMPISIDKNRSYSSNLDFGAYLLSSSPPVSFAISFPELSDCNGNDVRKFNCWEPIPQRPLRNPRDLEEDWARKKREVSPSHKRLGCRVTHSQSQFKTSNDDEPRSCLRLRHIEARPRSQTLPSKRVSFADDLGRSLFMVKFFEEMPDMPSYIHESVLQRNVSKSLSSLHISESCPDLGQASSKSYPTDSNCDKKFVLLPNFPMPASNYLAFRQKVDVDCVCLEHVHQAEPGSDLTGTIKVKEITFEKTVFIRCTFDNWISHTDYQATYVEPSNPHVGSRPLPYATFSFRVPVPKDKVKSAQLAVCYRADGKEYWDSNGGANYEFIRPEWSKGGDERRNSLSSERNTSGPAIFTANQSDDWASFAVWKDIETTVPYW